MSDPFPGLDIPITGGAYATADDLLLMSDLAEMDIKVRRWKRGGQPLRLRVRALDFDQQEVIERGALVKIDGQYVRSEAKFAALTLQHGVIVPKLTAEQANALRKHNPAIISTVVRFIWETLSILDQDVIDALANEQIPGAAEPAADAPPDADGDDPADVPAAVTAFPAERIAA